MSKNFTEAEGRRYKGQGFHCPQPKLRFSFVSKKLRSRTVSDVLFSSSVPHGVSFLIFMSMYIIYPDNKVVF